MTIVLAILAILAIITLRIVPRHPHIVDGDTIDVKGRRWRLCGYDAPEKAQPGGREATDALRSTLARNRHIGIVTGMDVYGRATVRLFSLRGPLATRMIGSGNGHALSLLGVPTMLFARIARRGIWAGRHDVVPPWTWRAAHPIGGQRRVVIRPVRFRWPKYRFRPPY